MNDFENERDETLVKLAQSGNKLAIDKLLRRHTELVRGCARRYFLLGGETEDLIQEGMIGLYHAILDYKEERGAFKSFARLCISCQILDVIKGLYRKKNGVMHTAQPLDVEMVEQGLSPEERLILEDEEREFRQKMGKSLSDFEFKVASMYIDGMTSAEICSMTGKSAKSVSNAIQRSKRKLLGLY